MQTAQQQQNPPGIAIISNSQTPYRLHLHRRIAREIPQIKLWSVFTHEVSNAPWAFDAPQEIGPVLFGKGETCDQQADWRNAAAEWRKAGRIIQWMRDQNIGAVVMMGYNDLGRMRIMRWCHAHDVPCFLFGDSNIRGDKARGLRSFVKKLVVGHAISWCDGVLVCGRLGREYFIKYGAKPDRIFYFPYEPDYQLIETLAPPQIDSVRTRFKLAADRKRIVYSGRLVSFKRVDLLIEQFVAIADERPQWDLLIIGDGPDRPALEAKIPAALESRITWTGFLDDQAVVASLYRLSDILAVPSDYEPWALVINEAAAAGLAIVSSTAVGAGAELVRDGQNGRLFPAGDGAALRQCLLDVTTPTRTPAMKSASRPILEDWRHRGDPVEGLRQALRTSRIL